MAPRLGGKECAEMYLNFGRFPDFPKNIPWGVTEIGKLLGRFTMKVYEILRQNCISCDPQNTDSENTKEAILDTLTDMLSALLDMPKTNFAPDTMLFEDLPLDSLQLYELVVDLETRYDIHISDEAIEMVQTIGDVAEMIFNAKN